MCARILNGTSNTPNRPFISARVVLERDLETMFPDPDTEILMYCGGGYRSILTAATAQEMGYRNVFSVMGGYKGLVAANWPMKTCLSFRRLSSARAAEAHAVHRVQQ